MDVALPFSVTESYNYQGLLDEAIETILSADVELSHEGQPPDAALEELVAPLRNLKEAQAFFSPDLIVTQLSQQDFQARQLKPGQSIEKLMSTHHLYLIQVPVTLKPAFGWVFTRLECGVFFEGVGAGPGPKAHDIYPDDIWSQILQLHTQLQVGVNAELSFQAEIEPIKATYPPLSGEAKAHLAVSTSGNSQLVVGPFNCGVDRPKVLGRGRGNSKVFWQLDGEKYVQREEPYLAVILQVPHTTQAINAQGRLIAYHKFNFLEAHLADWKGVFREKLRSFFSNGLPLGDVAIWKNVLA